MASPRPLRTVTRILLPSLLALHLGVAMATSQPQRYPPRRALTSP
ncbi:MAG: hypothetical protein RL260_1193 [Pseudomonadota bacterium]